MLYKVYKENSANIPRSTFLSFCCRRVIKCFHNIDATLGVPLKAHQTLHDEYERRRVVLQHPKLLNRHNINNFNGRGCIQYSF